MNSALEARPKLKDDVKIVRREHRGKVHYIVKETLEQKYYQFGEVEIDFGRSEAHKAGEPITLSPREFKLMGFLIEHRGEVLTRERLLDAVWGYDNVPFTRTVDMHIAKLRKKIEDKPHDPEFIVTVHRVGYKFTG